MGMMIEEAIAWLNTDDYESKGFEDATIVAISTMRKYQKIKQIVEAWVEAWLHDEDIDSYDSMTDIEEVTRNGDDD